MALKAGTVGVNPDILDNSGRVKEIPAGDHSLSFEVDEATGKAGYKIDDGDFHPFEEAGVTLMGWVKPATFDDVLALSAGLTLISGGIKVVDGEGYLDILVKHTTTQAETITIPLIAVNTAVLIKYGTVQSEIEGYEANTYVIATKGATNTTMNVGASATQNNYIHVFGMVKMSL